MHADSEYSIVLYGVDSTGTSISHDNNSNNNTDNNNTQFVTRQTGNVVFVKIRPNYETGNGRFVLTFADPCIGPIAAISTRWQTLIRSDHFRFHN